MASPQPDIFFKWSKELWKAILRWKFPGRTRQVFDAIAYLTYGQNPPTKERQISGKMLTDLTGLNTKQISKALTHLIRCHQISKNGDFYPASIGINKDYETWKLSPKMEKPRKQRVCGNPKKNLSPEMEKPISRNGETSNLHLLYLETRELKAHLNGDFEKFWKIYPLKKSKKKAQESWKKLSKKSDFPPVENIISAVENQIKEKQSLRQCGKFCPEWKYPATWLNQECWNDDCQIQKTEDNFYKPLGGKNGNS